MLTGDEVVLYGSLWGALIESHNWMSEDENVVQRFIAKGPPTSLWELHVKTRDSEERFARYNVMAVEIPTGRRNVGRGEVVPKVRAAVQTRRKDFADPWFAEECHDDRGIMVQTIGVQNVRVDTYGISLSVQLSWMLFPIGSTMLRSCRLGRRSSREADLQRYSGRSWFRAFRG